MTQDQQTEAIEVPKKYVSTLQSILEWLESGDNKDRSYNVNLEYLRLFLDSLQKQRTIRDPKIYGDLKPSAYINNIPLFRRDIELILNRCTYIYSPRVLYFYLNQINTLSKANTPISNKIIEDWSNLLSHQEWREKRLMKESEINTHKLKAKYGFVDNFAIKDFLYQEALKIIYSVDIKKERKLILETSIWKSYFAKDP